MHPTARGAANLAKGSIMRVPVQITGAVAGAVLLAGGCPEPAQAMPLSAGDKVVVEFGFDDDPYGFLGEVDLLRVSAAFSGFTLANVEFKVYDGATLLGEKSGPFQFGLHLFLIGPGSVFTFGPPVLLDDFSSIADGSIDGRIEITVLSGTTDLSAVIVEAGNATTGNTFGYADPAPRIFSTTVIPAGTAVPEPGALALLAGCLGMFGIAARRRRAA